MILAGDVGGTKTLLGLFARAGPSTRLRAGERPRQIHVDEFATLSYDSLAAMISEFLTARGVQPRQIEAGCFGVAGAVREQVARLTNVPWCVDAAEVSERIPIRHVRLLNDLEAMGYSIAVLEGDELAVLQEGEPLATGNAALIAAGTGLGQAILHNLDGRFVPVPSEGGHGDFAARTPREIELLVALQKVYGRVDWERVVSGPGLANLYRFTHATPCAEVDATSEDLPALVSAAGLARRCQRCVQALDLFVSAYGAEAGNVGLRAVATAGVYVGGGIAPKILPALERGSFLDAFRAKGPMADLMATIPVHVILNDHAGLLGAAVQANASV